MKSVLRFRLTCCPLGPTKGFLAMRSHRARIQPKRELGFLSQAVPVISAGRMPSFASSLTLALLTSILVTYGARTVARAASIHSRHRPIWRTDKPSWADGTRAQELAADCLEERWYDRRLDHFSRTKATEGGTWKQRVYVCQKWWSQHPVTGARGPIFFYAGNEGDVMLYVNNTGLMWENAASFGALLVFAEHRYYGRSEPFGPDSWSVDPSYLTTGQALADYADLIWTLKHSSPGAKHSAVIVFGGSYGGELAVWMRLKYPHLVQGSIAASAPILGFPGVPGFNPSAYWQVVTRGATEEAGSSRACVNNTRTGFQVLLGLRNSVEKWELASRSLRLCKPLEAAEDVVTAAYWVQGAWDAFAMGNYPYPSSYISGDPDHPLPAWPMREACKRMTQAAHMHDTDLLEAMARVAGLMYNASGTLKCFDLAVAGPAAADTGPWDFQVCTEQAQEQPYFPANGVTDMFWDQGPFDTEGLTEHCEQVWGRTPDWQLPWAPIQYGGLEALKQASNIVLSNGLLDPWSAFGVLKNVSDSVVTLLIPEGAHHVDLMFSHPNDTPRIRAARMVELAHMRRWISQHTTQIQGADSVRQAMAAAQA